MQSVDNLFYLIGINLININMRATKTTHIFEVDGHSVKFSSHFDSGNLRNVTQLSSNQFQIESALDSYQQPVTSKSFFHFSIQNFPKGSVIILLFQKLALLQSINQDLNRYRPVMSYNGQDYQKMPSQSIQINENILKLTIPFHKQILFLAFAFPYSYQRYLNMVRDLPQSNSTMYIHKEVLCYSNNLNLVYMISVSSMDKVSEEQEVIGELSNGIILPQKHLHEKKKYIDKPVILISGRVHPGQTPSSWAIEGILKFITGEQDQAKLLRKYFQIIIVPMLNPDGVFEGHYRLDTKGHNLNRYYLVSDNRQPSIYSMKHLLKHYHETKRLLYYFDFHGHPSLKGSFIYGNAIDELAYQAQTELFVRILSTKCITFEEKFCIFDREQMNSKDKYDMYTKQGCARVYAFKMSNILHSYTVELGFHSCSQFTQPSSLKVEQFFYSQNDYQKEGVAILQTVLESCGVKNSLNINKKSLRKDVADIISKRESRFRKQQKNINLKKQKVNEIIESQYWKPIRERYFKDIIPQKKGLDKIQYQMPVKYKKRQSLSVNLPSFFSKQITYDKQIEEKEIANEEFELTIEQQRKKIETTNIIFKIQKNKIQKSNSELEEKTTIKLMRINNMKAKDVNMQFTSQKDITSQVSNNVRDKWKMIRRGNFINKEKNCNSLVKDEQSIFSDINIRSQDKAIYDFNNRLSLKERQQTKSNDLKNIFRLGEDKSFKPKISNRINKIHSLFIGL